MTDEIRKQIEWLNAEAVSMNEHAQCDADYEWAQKHADIADSMEKLLALKKSAEVFRAHFDKSSISLEVKARTQLFEALEALK